MIRTSHYRRWQTVRLLLMFAGLAVGMIWGAGESWACILNLTIANPPCTGTGPDAYTCPKGEEVSFTTSLSAACAIGETIWRIIINGDTTDYTYTVWQPGFTHTFSGAGTYSVKPIVYPTSNPPSTRAITVTVPEAPFTVNILPSAGCTVLGRDGGVDAAEPDSNGIVCSTNTTDNALCTEQYQNSQIASLKVVTEPGYGFNGWIVNGGEVTLTAADPLLLTTMPTLASLTITLLDGTPVGNVKGRCEPQTVYLTFDDGPRRGTDDVTRILNALHEATDVRGSFFMAGFHTYLSGEGDVDMMNEAAYAQLTDCERILYVEPYLSEEPYNNQRKYFKEWPWMKDQVNALNALSTNADVVTILNHGYIHPDPTHHVLSITPSKYYTEWSPSQVVEDFTCNKERLLKVGASNGNFSIARCPTKNFWRLSNYEQPDGSGKEAADLLRDSNYQLYGWDVLWEFTDDGRPAESVNSVINKIKEIFDKNASSPVKRNKVIVLMHDIMFRHSNEDDVKLEALIQELHNLGYDFGILPQY